MKLIKNSPKIWIKKFPWKKKSSNKYSRGRVLILGGQKNMIGATLLAAEACLRVGVGSVKIICTKETIQILSIKFPSALKIEINNISYLRSFLKKESKTTAVALVGPGAGNNTKTMKSTSIIMSTVVRFRNTNKMVEIIINCNIRLLRNIIADITKVMTGGNR